MVRPAARQRLLRFLIVGGGAAALLFALSFLLVHAGLPPFFASTLAYAIAFAVAYSAQRSWTFAGEHEHSRALPRYFVLQAGCAAFSGVVSYVTVTLLGFSPLAMSATTTVVTSAASFFVSSLWVFPERGPERFYALLKRSD